MYQLPVLALGAKAVIQAACNSACCGTGCRVVVCMHRLHVPVPVVALGAELCLHVLAPLLGAGCKRWLHVPVPVVALGAEFMFACTSTLVGCWVQKVGCK